MEEEKRQAYSEVVEILKLVENEEKMEKIPFEVIQLIKSNADPTYTPKISKEIPLEEQNLKDETYRILGWIASKYWNEDISIKEEINDTEEISIASVYNDIEPECLEEKNLPIVATKDNWFERIKAKIIQVFKTLFKMNLNKKEEGVNE